jgi:hypothetical protein
LKISKGIRIPMEALYGNLPKTHSHTSLQKVRGYVDRLKVSESEGA